VVRTHRHERSFRREPLATCLVLASCFTSFGQTAADIGKAFAQGQFQQAVQLADAILKQQPDDAQLWTLRGAALSQLGHPKEGLASFEKALAISPRYLPAIQGAATSHAMLGAMAAEGHNCPQAVEEFAKASSAMENNPDALMQYGTCQLSDGQAASAAATFQRLLSLRPDDPSAKYKLAVSLGSAGNTAEALGLLKTLPPNSKVLHLSADYYEKQNDPVSAIGALRQAVALAPDEEQNYVELGQLYIEQREPEGAVEVANQGLRHLPGSARLYTIRGAGYTWLNEPERAAADFDRAERLEPDQLYGAIGLTMLLRQDQQLPEAIRILRQKLSERPNDATLNYLLADTLIRTRVEPGQPGFDEAVSLLRKAVALQPQFDKARITLGKAYLQASRPHEAEEQFREAVRRNPHDRSALMQLVLLLRRNGKKEEAALWSAKLKELVAVQ
jgi:tetratricopeptide (TPR) repeat protein